MPFRCRTETVVVLGLGWVGEGLHDLHVDFLAADLISRVLVFGAGGIGTA